MLPLPYPIKRAQMMTPKKRPKVFQFLSLSLELILPGYLHTLQNPLLL